MLKKLSLILTTLLLMSSCGALKKTHQVNAQHYVKVELEKIIDDLETAEPTGLPMKSLYLVDLAHKHAEVLSQLDEKATKGSAEHLLIAQLRGDGESLIKWSKDEKLVAQGHLMMGNWVEAKRMNLQDPATDAMIFLAEGDTLQAINALQHLITDKSVTRMIRLNGARQLCELVPDHYTGLNQIMMLTANPWEQFMANTLLDFQARREMRYDKNDRRQEIFVKSLEAKRMGDKKHLRDVGRSIMRERGGIPMDERTIKSLRQNFLEHELYPEALEMHSALPQEAQREYPYSLLNEYSTEIAALRSYEQGDEASTPNMGIAVCKTSEGGTFRSKWGSVRNVDNWAMVYSSDLSNGYHVSHQKLTLEQYESLRQQLRAQINSQLNISTNQ